MTDLRWNTQYPAPEGLSNTVEFLRLAESCSLMPVPPDPETDSLDLRALVFERGRRLVFWSPLTFLLDGSGRAGMITHLNAGHCTIYWFTSEANGFAGQAFKQ